MITEITLKTEAETLFIKSPFLKHHVANRSLRNSLIFQLTVIFQAEYKTLLSKHRNYSSPHICCQRKNVTFNNL
jgi:hypothetical protein